MSTPVFRRKLGLVVSAISVALLAIALLSFFALKTKIADVMCGFGERRFQEGQRDKALSDFNWAVRIDPKFSMAFSDRGMIWMLDGAYDAAIYDLDEAIRLDPSNSKAFNNRGLTRIYKGQPDKALSDLNESLRLNPRNAVTLGNRGLAWHSKGNLDRAFADYDNAIRLDPSLAPNFDLRGLAWLVRSDYVRSVADFREAIRLDPSRSSAISNLAWLEATCPNPQFRDGTKAVEHATRACELSGWKTPNRLSTLAAAYAETGDFQNAVKWMEKAIELDPSSTSRSTLELFKARKPYRQDGSATWMFFAPPGGSDLHF
jgi:tetratricopeptide (TPR) repeat protein